MSAISKNKLANKQMIPISDHRYDHKKIEAKWQKIWQQKKIYQTRENPGKKKCYVLDMFPYPSGDGLHVGHVEGYTATDIYARYRRMNGDNVLHPMGWDAFGLPAENFAIKNKIHPRVAVEKNIKKFKQQLQRIGFSYDWEREVDTTDPNYYRWTQWIFLQMFKRGLAYQSDEPIIWCPSCQTGLANEDLEDGRCERCGSVVEKKPLRQWVLKITAYADRLLRGLAKLPWPESVKESQRNWIGRSVGAELSFALDTKYHFVLLHGFKSSSRGTFFPWLKKELEQRGHQVSAIDLPASFLPDIDQQVATVLSQVKFDKQTVLLGHSLGSVVALRILEKIPVKIRKTILVAGLMEPHLNSYPSGLAKRLFDWRFDFKKIKDRAGDLLILRDPRDPVIAADQALRIQQALGGKIFDIKAKKAHVCGRQEVEVLHHCLDQVTVFTTRPDTLYGATYLVLAPEHPLLDHLSDFIGNWPKILSYRQTVSQLSELDRSKVEKTKTGVKISGVEALNPATGQKIPIWVADYVLADYGSGAVMAVPAHDQRDWLFAKKFKLPIIEVVAGGDISQNAFVDDGIMINSGSFNGLPNEQAKFKIVAKVGGKKMVKYKIRDWVFSRQRYWGEPIPIIHCPKCGPVAVPEKALPVKLPPVKNYTPSGTGESPLAKIHSWVKVRCPLCQTWAKRETNTMPQWAGSCWYYLRYADPHNRQHLIDPAKDKTWQAVDVYVGGVEHATRHLIYARFWHKFLKDIGVVSRSEPFWRLKNQGLVLGADGRKMSKRWGNVVNPDDVVATYGADTLRLYEMFMGPFEQSISWSDDSLQGIRRFLDRLWRLRLKVGPSQPTSETEYLLHATIAKVSRDIESFDFNTAVSALMILVNHLESQDRVCPKHFRLLLLILSPFAPHLMEELWQYLGESDSIINQKWPKALKKKLSLLEIDIVIQVDGRVRGTIKVGNQADQADIKRLAVSKPEIAKWLQGREIIKEFYRPGRLLNLVTTVTK